MQKTRDIKTISLEFDSIIKSIITKFGTKNSTIEFQGYIYRISQQIVLLHMSGEYDYIIQYVGPHLYNYHEQIISRDESFFLNMRVELGQDKFLIDFIEMIKDLYTRLRKGEKDDLYSDVKKMHDNYLEYLLLKIKK